MKSNGADCPGIKIRGNTVVGKEDPPDQWLSSNTKKWDSKIEDKCISMGKQFTIEELFSSIRRIFREIVTAASPDEMILEVKRAFIL